jgi:hypothetical protein
MADHEEVPRPQAAYLSTERIQTGVRMEKRMVKVLKALAEYFDISLGDLLEGIVLHAFESKPPFSAETLQRIAQLKEVYGMDYGAEASHRLTERVSDEGEQPI